MVISLNRVDDVKRFINISQSCAGSVEVKSGKYTVDGKSILGIFSLDLSKPVEVVCDDKNDEQKFEEFMVK